MDNYILRESWDKPNIQEREYVAQDENEKDAMLARGGLATGDKVYVIESKKTYMLGFDNKWYDATESGGAAPILEDVTVSYTTNSVYNITASSGYDGIGSAEITVNVSPALETLEVTYLENGEYTIRPTAGIDGISEATITVNVPSSSGNEETSVFLYDYDGEIIASYTPTAFAALPAYPAAPVHEGLTFQEYNWPLATAKEYVANYGRCDIGATYITSDGKTRIYFYLNSSEDLTVTLWLGVNGEAVVEWGDESSSSITGEDDVYSTEHTYAEVGHYVITITAPDGDDITLTLCGGSTSEDSPFFVVGSAIIEKLELGNRTILGWAALDNVNICSVVIPNIATEIPYGVFYSMVTYQRYLKHITIPNGVTYIGNCAFDNLAGLRSISLPPSVTDMQCGMKGCESLWSVCIPPLVSEICEYAFASCTALSNIVIPNGVNTIGSYAFCDYEGSDKHTALTSIIIPDSMTSIGDYAVCGCISLSKITIGSGLTTVGDSAFSGCPLSFVILSNELTTLPSFQHSGLSSITIPSNIEDIPDMALADTCIQTIIIPETVQYLGGYAFSNSNLFSAYIGSSNVGSNIFDYCYNLRTVVFSENVSYIEGNTFLESGAHLETLTFEGMEPPTLGSDMYVPSDCIIRVPQGSLEAYTSAENYPDPSEYTYIEY